MKIVFKFPNREEIILGRLAAGDSFKTNLFGNTHNKLISRQELGDLPFRPVSMLMTFEKMSGEVTSLFVETNKRYLAKPVTIEFPERNRKYTGVITSVSYVALREDAEDNTMFDLNVEFMATIKDKIETRIQDSPED